MMRAYIFPIFILVFFIESSLFGEEKTPLLHGNIKEQLLLYTAKKLGVPVLRASIKIENGLGEVKKPYGRIEAHVHSLPNVRFLFWMDNRFTSIMDENTGSPIQYIKEIHQGGLFIRNKNYRQVITFDPFHQKVIIENGTSSKKKESKISSETYDPLSLFAKYYLREEISPGQKLSISVFDGFKHRQMVFNSREERIEGKFGDSIETICLESSTAFSTFGEKEGQIRIWYTANGKKIPLIMELSLPIGSLEFELEEIRETIEGGPYGTEKRG